jgi:hypothetical protein
MTVKELIEQLQQLDPDLHVFTEGYEGGYNDIVILEDNILEIALDVHTEWWYGKHEDADSSYFVPDKTKYTIVKSIIL